MQREVDSIREKRNQISAKMKGGKPEQSLIDEGKQIKVELAERETYLNAAESELKNMLTKVPNIIFDEVPLGGEEDSVEVKSWGRKAHRRRNRPS